MKTLTHSLCSLPFYVSGAFDELALAGPRRKRLRRPASTGKFILPLRQSLIMDARLMPGTLRMLALLAGWAGHGAPLDTNLCVIGKHLGRSARQVQRYLKDAAEEGYLYVRQRVNRLGYVIGLRIHLCRAAIYAPKMAKVSGEAGRQGVERISGRRKPATTDRADTNENISIYLKRSDPFEARLAGLCERLGLDYKTSS